MWPSHEVLILTVKVTGIALVVETVADVHVPGRSQLQLRLGAQTLPRCLASPPAHPALTSEGGGPRRAQLTLFCLLQPCAHHTPVINITINPVPKLSLSVALERQELLIKSCGKYQVSVY